MAGGGLNAQGELITTEPEERLPEATEVVDRATGEIAQLLQLAIKEKIPVEALEKLQGLYERAQDRSAKAEFNQALHDFQAECPPIKRSATAEYVTGSGAKVKYTYADLPEIAKIVRPLLIKRGFSWTWDQELEGDKLTITCILSHINGHSEKSRYSTPVSATDRMSSSQKTGGAATVARRQSLVSVLGLTDVDLDDDGREPGAKISEGQAATLAALIEEVKADRAKILKLTGAATLADIRVTQYPEVVRALEARRRAQK